MVSDLHRAVPAALLLLLATRPLDAAAADGAMPFDVAFSRAGLGYEERPAISNDGTMLAYTVHTPPARSSTEARYLPNGVPASAIGNAIFVTVLASGERRPVGPPRANCWRPAFSPDGTRLAFYCDANDVPTLWIHDLATNTARRLSEARIKPKLWAGDEPQWSPDGTEIFVPLAPTRPAAPPSPATRASIGDGSRVWVHPSSSEPVEDQAVGSEDRDFATIFMRENNAAIGAIAASSGAVRTVVSADADPPPSVLQLSPTGRWLAYLSVYRMPSATQTTSYHDLVVVPAAGGAIRKIAELQVTEDNYFLDAYSWHSTRDQLFWVHGNQLWTIDLSSPAAEPRRLAPQLTDVARRPIAVTRDGMAVIVGVRPLDLRDYRDPYPQALAVVPLAGGAPKVIDLPKGAIFQELLQRRSTAWQPQADALTVRIQEHATAQTAMLRLDLRSGRWRTLWRGLAQFRPAGAPADHHRLIASFEDLNTPVDFYGWDATLRNQRRLSEIEPRLRGVRFGTAETFETTVPQFDGATAKVTTAVLLPAGAKRGDRLPTLVFLYPGDKVTTAAAQFGGGSPATIPVSIFTTRGYAVLLAALPIGPDGKAGNPADEIVDVLLPQVYRAAELGYTDIERVGVSGQSYGGYGTASVISGTNLFRGAVAISGMYDLPGLYAWAHPQGIGIHARWAEAGQGRMGTHPWADLRRYLHNSPYYRADRIQTPLLMLHGQIDEACPVEDARKMFNALKRLDRTVQLAEYAGEGHVVSQWSLAHAVDAARRMVEFLDRHLRASKPAVDSAAATSAP